MHVDSDVHRYDIATHSLLGGQHGEESEEGKEGEEEGQQVNLAPERRSRQRCRQQRRKGRRGRQSVRAMLLMATPALVDDRGRRRNRGTSFTGTGFRSG